MDVAIAASCFWVEYEPVNGDTIAVVVNDDGAIELPHRFGYEQGYQTGAAVKLRPVEVNGQPFDSKLRPSAALHIDDEHLLVTVGLTARSKLHSSEVQAFGLQPGDEVVFDVEEDQRSDEELEAADKEWRSLHGVSDLTDDEIAKIASDATRNR